MFLSLILGVLAGIGGICSGLLISFILRPKVQLFRMRRDLDEGLQQLVQLQQKMLTAGDTDPKDLADVARLIREGEELMRDVEELTRRISTTSQAPPVVPKSHEQYASQ